MKGKKPGILAVAIVGALALAFTTAGATAVASSGTAMAAKKHCKKQRARSAKKRKCRRSAAPMGNASMVRATLTWSNGGADDVDMDLFVFDASGNQAGNGSDTIPMSTLSPDVMGRSGSETFTDQAFNLRRPLSFGVCYRVGGSVHTDYTITYVTADGATHTQTRAGDGMPPSLGSSAHVDYPGGAPISNYCPGTNLVP